MYSNKVHDNHLHLTFNENRSRVILSAVDSISINELYDENDEI